MHNLLQPQRDFSGAVFVAPEFMHQDSVYFVLCVLQIFMRVHQGADPGFCKGGGQGHASPT